VLLLRRCLLSRLDLCTTPSTHRSSVFSESGTIRLPDDDSSFSRHRVEDIGGV
jgi:hypothetical protein